MKKFILFILFFSSTIFSQEPTSDYQGMRKKILEPYCLRCHSGPHAPKGLDYSTYDSMVKNPPYQVVVPGFPGRSILYEEIESGGMPKGGPRLSDEEIQFVYDWIANGALETEMSKSI
jgi:hypothetical protein